VRHFGEDKLLELLDRMARKESVDKAFQEVYLTTFGSDGNIMARIHPKNLTWFTYLSNHMYEILFVAGAMLTVIGFLKLIPEKTTIQR
jgi:hypothetical protein